MVKRILQVFLVLIFLVFVVCCIVVGSYVFSSPSIEPKSESRILITGAWTSEEKDRKLVLDENGNFSFSELKSGKVLADGYFRINEDRNIIKLFMIPGHHEEAFDKYMKLMFFAQISYSDLNDPSGSDIKQKDAEPSTGTFLFKTSDDDGEVFKMTQPERTFEPYSHGKHFTAKSN